MKKILVISTLLAITFVASSLMAQSDPATQAMKKKVDSLFVIASSGELKYRDKVEPAIEAIAKIGVPAAPHLIDKFTTNSARERLTIINILIKIGSPVIPDLVTALSRKEWLVVKRVCWALGDIKDKSAVKPLTQVANHRNWQVREYCIGALGKIGGDEGLSTILAAFDDSLGQVRKAAAYATGEIKNSVTTSMVPDLPRWKRLCHWTLQRLLTSSAKLSCHPTDSKQI
jgi:HEAT repeat protein